MIFFEAHKRIGMEQQYYVKVLENVSWGLHFHSAYECISVLEGSVECVIGHERNTLTKGEAAFIMPEQLHSIETRETSKVQVLVFLPELAEDFHAVYQEKVPQNVKFVCAVQEWEKEPENIYLLKALLFRVCGSLVQQTAFVKRKTLSQDRLLYSLISYIEEHYMEECSLNQVAQICNCDYFYASKIFSETAGMGFLEYVNRLRIYRACHMLRETDYSVLRVSEECGFQSLRSFNRNFTKYVKCKPTQYRRENKLV